MKKSLLVGVLIVMGLSGCSMEVKVNEKNETELGSHPLVIKPGSSITSSSSSSGGEVESYQFRSGDVTVEIKNDELTVNNVRYGILPAGADILVDHGAVFIDGKEREGNPMTPEEIMDAAPVKEVVKDLSGYEVTVRPGSNSTSITQVFGRHTLTVGGTRVLIRNNELTVNGEPYGKLSEGDTILVELGAVTVSGEVREPME